MQANYIIGPWKGIYDYQQYLLVTADNLDSLRQTEEGKKMIPNWLTASLLTFPKVKSGKQLVVSCRGKITEARPAVETPSTTTAAAPSPTPSFIYPHTEVNRLLRPRGYWEIVEFGLELYSQKKLLSGADIEEMLFNLSDVQRALANDSNISKEMAHKLLQSNNHLHKSYTDIPALIRLFGGTVPKGDFIYGVDEVGHHPIPGHLFDVKEEPLVHTSGGQIMTVDALFGVVPEVDTTEPTAAKDLSDLGRIDKVEMYKQLYQNARLVPPGFIGIWSTTIPTGSTWAVRPEAFRFEVGFIGERTYFLSDSPTEPPADKGRRASAYLGKVEMTDADGNLIKLDVLLRLAIRPRVWPVLRYVFGYEELLASTGRFESSTEFNVVNSLLVPVLKTIVAKVISHRHTSWFYGEGEKQDELSSLEEINELINTELEKQLGFLGVMLIAAVENRQAPEEFEKARAARSIAQQGLEAARAQLETNKVQAQALVVEADGKARAKALEYQRHIEALVQSLGPEGGLLAALLERTKVPNVAVQGGSGAADASTAAAVAVGMVSSLSQEIKNLAASVPLPPPTPSDLPEGVGSTKSGSKKSAHNQ